MKIEKPILSVVVLNYNVKHFLQLCLDSVQKALQDIPAEIIVVDNASSDRSLEMVREHFPKIKLIVNKNNEGFSKGNNIGIEQASGTYLCILNPDTVVSENTFKDLIDFHKKTPQCGIVGPRLIDGSAKFLLESKRGVPTPLVAFSKVFGLYKISKKSFGKFYSLHLNEFETGPAPILVGAFMFMEREVFIKAGKFDEQFFMYGEDMDLSYRVEKLGYTNYYFGSTTAVHFKGESTQKDSRYQLRFQQALQLFYDKHFSPNFWVRIFVNAATSLFSLFKKYKSSRADAKQISRPSSYVIISKNNTLVDRFSKTLYHRFFHFESLMKSYQVSTLPYTEYLLDMDAMTYEELIVFMNHAPHQATFKIKPQNANFFVGSNDSNCRGEILVIGETYAKKIKSQA